MLVAISVVTAFALSFSVASAQSASDGPIYIDLAAPLTGARAEIGRDVRVAAGLAVEALNARGGVLGRRVAVRIHDDGCSAVGAAKAAATVLAAEPVASVVIGHACPSASDAVAPIYSAKGLCVIVAGALPGSRAGTTGKRQGNYLFRLPGDGNQGVLIGELIVGDEAALRIALVRDKTLYATTIMQQVYPTIVNGKKPPVLIEFINGGDKDFVALAERLKAANVTHMVLAGFANEAGLIVNEVVKRLPEIRILGTDSLAVSDFPPVAGAAISQVEIMLAPDAEVFASADDVVVQLAKAGGKPTRPALAIYSAIQVWAAAVAAAKSSIPAAVSAQLSLITTPTVLGAVSFDANGTARLPAFVKYRWSKSSFVPVERRP